MLYQLLSILNFTASLAGAPDSAVSAGTQVFVQGFIPGDTVRYEFYSKGVLTLTKRTVAASFKTTLPAPAYGATIEYKGCAQIERGGRTSTFKVPATPMCWTWNYTRPMPALVMDSLKQIVLRPPELTLDAAGATYQFCAFGLTKAGRKVKLKNAWNRAECAAPFQAWLAEALS